MTHHTPRSARSITDLATPAVVVDIDALEHNLAAMSERLPGALLRPHVKAHKSTALAALQRQHGHHHFTCATVREMIGMANAGLGDDLLLANEVLDAERLAALAAVQDRAMITIAVDSDATVDAAARAGIKHVLIDVNIGLPRCGCAPHDAARLAERARTKGLVVRGVMGYEGHLMVNENRATHPLLPEFRFAVSRDSRSPSSGLRNPSHRARPCLWCGRARQVVLHRAVYNHNGATQCSRR